MKIADWNFGRSVLVSESVEGATLSLESVDDVYGGDGLALGVLSVSNGVANHVLQEDLQNSASLLVDKAGDPFHAAPSCQTTNGRLRNALDVISQNLAMPLRASLSQAFSTFASTRHDCVCRTCITSATNEQLMRFERVRPLYKRIISYLNGSTSAAPTPRRV